MRLKFLLVFLMAFGMLHAQEPYRNLIISEASLGAAPEAYIELTNKGDVTINLNEFELGKVTPWTSRIGWDEDNPPPIEDWFDVPENDRMMLPDWELAPGESWVMGRVSDWRLQMERIDPFVYRFRASHKDMYEVADYHMHGPELPATPPATDSVDPKYGVLEVWHGRDAYYIRHHFMNAEGEKDSVVIDQVGGVFDGPNGQNRSRGYSVAGIPGATGSQLLLRKADIMTGNLDFNDGRGVDLADSEWMPLPRNKPGGPRQPLQWHIGNHGPFVLDENTLTPKAGSGVTVDFANEVINVPWGIQRDDSLVYQFERTDGMGWNYRYVPDENSRWNEFSDSAYLSARTGDTLRVYIAGNTLQWKDFHIEVGEPAEDANIVMPKKSPSFTTGWYGNGSAYIDAARFRATGGNEVDTIKHNYNIPGIAFATRVDTLYKYLEKAPAAEFEIEWVDGVERLDLKHGDILKVTAENGAVKDYFIKVGEYRPSDNAHLDAITWPDIPEVYRGILGWQGDTIPNFSPTVYSYNLSVPGDVDGFPALIAKPQSTNATVEVSRATSFAGPRENRTVTFTVTAESDTTVRVYTVLLEKEKLPRHVQPYHAEPLISEFIFWEQWNNGMREIANTGNQPLDLSNYMIVNAYLDGPAEAISWGNDFEDRYQRYIPGYKWTSSASEWEIMPRVAEPDPAVNPIIAPGDVFALGEIRTWNFARDYENWNNATWWVPEQLDINFGFEEVDGERIPKNPWGEHFVDEEDSWGESVGRIWKGADFYVFKILNDSIKLGLKSATDPNDFELIEIFGTGNMDEYDPVGNGAPMISSFVRKPEYVFPNPVPGGSFGATVEESEWTTTNQAYWIEQNVGWPQEILFVALGIGTHSFIAPTHYMSTVTSLNYVVSPGYEEEEIRGIVTGTTVDQFLGYVSKADPDQTLAVLSDADTLQGGDALTDGDILSVMSADSTNITHYALQVSEDGLSDNAILTSAQYAIEVEGEAGTISGFEYGTTVKAVRDGVTVPAGARLTIVDADDRYVPLRKPNFDTIYVDVMVTDQIYFEVVAEDGETKVLYHLMPDSDPSDAYVFSEVYTVNQELLLIELVPVGTSVSGLLQNLVPSRGATIEVTDRELLVREKGTLYRDDRITVTSEDGSTTNVYFLSMLEVKTWFAYVVSEKYDVDQVTLRITVEEDDTPTVAAVLAEIEPAEGATVEIMDAAGAFKDETALVENGDVLRVTSADGATITNYTVDLIITSVEELTSGILMYPNPSTGIVYMEGLEVGTRVQVFNIVGVPVFTKVVQNTNEVLQLEDQPAGLYFVVVTSDKEVVGRYRLILR